MAILVCGGAGYIGSNFCRLLNENHEKYVVVDALITGHRESLPDDTVFYSLNLLDKEQLRKVFEENSIEAVVHFAASSLVGESLEKPIKYFKNNCMATMVLLEVMEEFKVDKLVFSSTAAVYGNPNLDSISEETVPSPLNPYGESKLAMERMIKWHSDTGKLNYISLRYFNVAGASEDGLSGEDHNPETHIIPLAIKAALENGTFKIFGTDYPTEDGTCIRDYIHVEDLCDAHLKALNHLRAKKDSGTFNLGYGRGFSVKEIIKEVKEVTGIDFKVEEYKRRPGDPPRLIANADKAREVLGWEPNKDDLSKIINSAWIFHKRHPHGYSK